MKNCLKSDGKLSKKMRKHDTKRREKMIHGNFDRCSKVELTKEVFCRGMILDNKDTKKSSLKN